MVLGDWAKRAHIWLIGGKHAYSSLGDNVHTFDWLG
jgi:hypothetical protein